jgi:sigma-E factor negative regulatory protein RseC
MIEEQAIVVDSEGGYVWVQTQRKSSCESCSVKGGCGTGVLAKVLGTKVNQIKCLNNKQLKIGDQVVIGIDENALLSGSFLVYLLPLLLMLVSGGLAIGFSQLFFTGFKDLFAIAGSAVGLITGLAYAKKITQDRKYGSQYQPVILKKVSSPAHLLHLEER